MNPAEITYFHRSAGAPSDWPLWIITHGDYAVAVRPSADNEEENHTSLGDLLAAHGMSMADFGTGYTKVENPDLPVYRIVAVEDGRATPLRVQAIRSQLLALSFAMGFAQHLAETTPDYKGRIRVYDVARNALVPEPAQFGPFQDVKEIVFRVKTPVIFARREPTPSHILIASVGAIANFGPPSWREEVADDLDALLARYGLSPTDIERDQDASLPIYTVVELTDDGRPGEALDSGYRSQIHAISVAAQAIVETGGRFGVKSNISRELSEVQAIEETDAPHAAVN